MIGVVPGTTPAWVVEEFFQLFKTPWEFWSDGRAYDVVMVADAAKGSVVAPLVILMGAHKLASDEELGFSLATVEGADGNGRLLTDVGESLPIYGPMVSVAGPAGVEKVGEVGRRTLGLRRQTDDRVVIRLGYDVFEEVRWLLTSGQPVQQAGAPTLDLHLARLRRWMREAGVEFVEIPPVPDGHPFMVALTHDIDFIGIRRHFCDHTMFGFLLRATAGSLKGFLRGRLSWGRLWRNWMAAAKLPFVYLGLARDFWEPFSWLLQVEQGIPATYYLIPFKRRPGRCVRSAHPERRGTAYDVTDMPEWCRRLRENGCEIGVHGIDAWHDAVAGREERQRIESVTGRPAAGIRMHWLEFAENSFQTLEAAGFDYDTTMGFNESVGYRQGTTQAYRPPGAAHLLELPMHIQDGALFYPTRLNLSETAAHERCASLRQFASRLGGVLTVLWHDRSHAPDRNWGEFYRGLVAELSRTRAWFATAGQVVRWFRQRREFRFVERAEGLTVYGPDSPEGPGFVVRRHDREGWNDVRWPGRGHFVPRSQLRAVRPETARV